MNISIFREPTFMQMKTQPHKSIAKLTVEYLKSTGNLIFVNFSKAIPP